MPGGGAQSLRSAAYLRLLLGAALISIPAGLVTLAFVGAFQGLEEVLWDTVPDAFGVNPHDWWPVVPTTLGGIAVGLVLRYVPGHGGPAPPDGHGVGGEQGAAGLKAVPGLLLAAILSLAAGASLGPEMPLLAAIVTVGGLSAVTMRLPEELVPGLVIAAVAAVFGGLFASPLLGAILLLELPGRPAAQDRDRYTLILPALLGSAIGYLVFLATVGEAFAAYDLPAFGQIHPPDVAWALGIGIAGGLIGLAFIRVFRLIDPLVSRIDRPVLLGAAGGILIGLVAIAAGSRTLFSGEHELQEVIDAHEPLGVLMLLVLGKGVALLISLMTGFRGGRIFPLFFLGGVLGLALAEVTSVPVGLSVPCAMLSVAIPAMRLPLLLIVVVAFFTSAAALPLLVIAGAASYLVCHDQPELRDPPSAEPAPEAGG
jgi:H+/Cl- antiporter ClcA